MLVFLIKILPVSLLSCIDNALIQQKKHFVLSWKSAHIQSFPHNPKKMLVISNTDKSQKTTNTILKIEL